MSHFFSLSLFIFWSCLEFPWSVDAVELGVGGDRRQAFRADERGPPGSYKRCKGCWRKGSSSLSVEARDQHFHLYFFTFYVFLYDWVFSWTEVQRTEFITAVRVSFSSLAPVSPPLVWCLEFLFSGFPLLSPLTTQATFLTCPCVPVCPCARFSVQTTCRSGLRLNISVSFSFPPSAQYYDPSMALGGSNSLSLTGAWHSVVATAHCPSDGHLRLHYRT